MRRFLLYTLLPLAACATPLEQCINNAGKDIRVLSGLIATTQGNISRGYALRTENYFEDEEQACGEVNGETVYCDVPVAFSRQVPLAIDLNAEQAKLNSLLTKRDELSQTATSVVAQCRVVYPEA